MNKNKSVLRHLASRNRQSENMFKPNIDYYQADKDLIDGTREREPATALDDLASLEKYLPRSKRARPKSPKAAPNYYPSYKRGKKGIYKYVIKSNR